MKMKIIKSIQNRIYEIRGERVLLDFDLATLYALTGGLGVKVKIDDKNYNYHVLYKTGKTKPNEEVMSGRSFASSPRR